MSTTSAGLAGALIDPVSIVVIGPLSEDEGGAFVTPMIVGESWTRSSLISKITTGASDVEVLATSCIVATSSGE